MPSEYASQLPIETPLISCSQSRVSDSSPSSGVTNGGIANPFVIDLFGVDQKSGEVFLLMYEPRPWCGGDEQLHELQEKFNAYAAFILDGEMLEAHPELKGTPVRIELRCDYPPNQQALALVEAIHDQLELQSIKVEVIVRDRECNDSCRCRSGA